MASEECTTSKYFFQNRLKTHRSRSSEQKNFCNSSKSVGHKRPKLSAEVNNVDCTRDVAELTVGLRRHGDDFYNVPCQDLAKKLLGKVLTRRLSDDIVLKGRIVETECYLGGEDKASHSYGGKLTERNKPMYMKPGTAYVYFTYGMYHCFNISSHEPGSCVLLRSLEPLEGLQHMQNLRKSKKKKKKEKQDCGAPAQCSAKDLKDTELCNGPAKLCISFDINKENSNTKDLCCWDGMWIEDDSAGTSIELHSIVSCPRIGIDSAGVEWVQKPLRYYILGNKFVSRRDKVAEKQHMIVPD